MTRKQDSAKAQEWIDFTKRSRSKVDGRWPLVAEALQQILEGDMEEALGAGKWERTWARLGYRSGYYERDLITRIGKVELRVPRDRQGRFRTELFDRYERSEKALVQALAEMYIQRVSTRKVKAITEQLCGHEFAASTISRITQHLDEELKKFAERLLEDPYPYVILDARYETVREGGVIRNQAVEIAIGIDWEGRRNVLAVELANRKPTSSWKESCRKLKQRGCMESTSSSVMTTRGYERLSRKRCRKQPGNGATCTFSGMHSTTSLGKLTTTA